MVAHISLLRCAVKRNEIFLSVTWVFSEIRRINGYGLEYRMV